MAAHHNLWRTSFIAGIAEENTAREWYAASNEPPRALAPSARDAIDVDPWPGNARELEAALRRAVAAPGDAPIEASDLGLAGAGAHAALPEALRASAEAVPTAGDARDFSSVIEELDAARAAEAAGEDYATTRDEPPTAVAPPSQSEAPALSSPAAKATTPLDLRAFARSAAREVAPALEALRSSGDATNAARLTRRLARLEQFAALEANADARSEAAPVLAALLAERRDELLAKRLLVLRELESDDTTVRANEPALRFAFSALLDALLEAAPSRTDLYISARPTTAEGRAHVRIELRLRGARIPEDALDLILATDVLERIGATLSLEISDSETRTTITLAQ